MKVNDDVSNFSNIETIESWKEIFRINDGWSGELKFEITSKSRMILRLGSIDNLKRLQNVYNSMLPLREINLPVSIPIAFGKCLYLGREYCYTLLSWINGSDAKDSIASFSIKDQYAIGLCSGKILKKLHQLPIPKRISRISWQDYFNTKINKNIKASNDCPVQFEGARTIIKYINSNRDLLCNRPMSFQHGDYHIGNMVLDRGSLGVIDFNRQSYGDPWEEYSRISWCGHLSPAFASGRIDGYFDGDVSESFFKLMALYIGSNQLSSIPWAMQFGKKDVDVMIHEAERVLYDYDEYNTHIPKWYLRF